MTSELDTADYAVNFKGVPQYYLSKSIALRNNITLEQLEKLKQLHVRKLELFEQMAQETDRVILRKMAAEFEQIEFKMQENWNFPQDRNMHEWYTAPQCTCPKMDNRDNRGTKYRTINLSCPVHGGEE